MFLGKVLIEMMVISSLAEEDIKVTRCLSESVEVTSFEAIGNQ